MYFTFVFTWILYVFPNPFHCYINITWWRHTTMNYAIPSSSLLEFNLLITLFLNSLNIYSFLNMNNQVSNTDKQHEKLYINYLLTPWSRVLLEKLTSSAASQEIPRISGTRRFITVLASARNLSLSWAHSIQSPQPPTTSWWSILILSSHLRLGLLSGCKTVYYIP